MNYNKFDENQWTFDLPDQAEENTASSDNSDSGLKQVAENTSVPNRSGSGYEKGKNGSNKRVSRYKSPGASRAAASGSGGNSGEEAKKKRTLFNALVSAVCIAAIILGTGLATGELWPGKKYTVTVENGSGSGEYRPGDDVTIQADPAKDGYTFIGWSVSDENVISSRYRDRDRLIFEMPAEDFTVTAEYTETQYTLTVENGMIEDAGNSGSFTEGTKIDIRADSKDGHTFIKWEVTEGNATFNDASFQEAVVTIGSEDTVIQAVYTENKYTLSIKGGTLEGDKTSGSFTEGTKITVCADSKDGYTFNKWEVTEGNATFNDVSSQDAEVTIGSEDAVIQAVYTENKYTLSIKGGTLAGGKTSGSFTEGTKIAVWADRADSKDGYTFKKWEVTEGNVTFDDASIQEAVVTIGSEDAVIQAVYTENKYTLSIKGGTIEGGKTSGSFTEGTNVTIQADEKAGYEFISWSSISGDAKITDESSPITQVVTGRQASEITAKYEEKKYTVAVTYGTGGGSYEEGYIVYIEADYREGYEFDHWSINRGTVAFRDEKNESTYFNMPAEDVEIAAVYIKNNEIEWNNVITKLVNTFYIGGIHARSITYYGIKNFLSGSIGSDNYSIIQSGPGDYFNVYDYSSDFYISPKGWEYYLTCLFSASHGIANEYDQKCADIGNRILPTHWDIFLGDSKRGTLDKIEITDEMYQELKKKENLRYKRKSDWKNIYISYDYDKKEKRESIKCNAYGDYKSEHFTFSLVFRNDKLFMITSHINKSK